MANTPVKVKRLPLGSAKTYVVEITEENKLSSDIDIAKALTIIDSVVKEDNLYGNTKNGATANYSATYYTEKDDFGELSKTIITDENFTISLGVVSFNHDMVNKTLPTGEYSTDNNGNEMTKIGGIQNDNQKKYLVVLVHEDKVDGDIIYMIHAKNVAAISWAFTKNAGTTTSPSFQAEPFDTKGRCAILLTRKHPSTATTNS